MNKTDLVLFVESCTKVRAEAGAQRLVEEYQDRFSSEAWWCSEGTYGERLHRMIPAIMPLYLQEKVLAKPRKVSSPTREKREKPVQASMLEKLENGDRVEESKDFDSLNDAEKWIVRRLASYGGPRSYGLIVDHRFRTVVERRISLDAAIKLTFGRRVTAAESRSMGSSGSGPWMKAKGDRFSFSKG